MFSVKWLIRVIRHAVKPIFVLHLKLINRMWAEIVGYAICLAVCGMRSSPSPELGKGLGVYCFGWKRQQSELLECYDLSQAYHKPSKVIVIGHRKGNITSLCREVYSAAWRQAPLYPPLRKKNDVLPRATIIFCEGVLCLYRGVMWSGKMDYKTWIRSQQVI